MRSLVLVTLLTLSSALLAQTAPPPAFGEETKGEPAPAELEQTATETEELEGVSSNDADSSQVDAGSSGISNLLGDATITESRRENGQVYEVELDHSAGAKQYIQDSDSDGKLQPTGNDLEEEPNIPKWRLGRW